MIEISLKDPQLEPAHGFLKHLLRQLDSAVTAFLQEARDLGEAAFTKQMRDDIKYWVDCQKRWGGGKGYKNDITKSTITWFSSDTEIRRERFAYLYAELKRRWREMLGKVVVKPRLDGIAQ